MPLIDSEPPDYVYMIFNDDVRVCKRCDWIKMGTRTIGWFGNTCWWQLVDGNRIIQKIKTLPSADRVIPGIHWKLIENIPGFIVILAFDQEKTGWFETEELRDSYLISSLTIDQ
jgi:hypothetical protein